MVRVSNHRDQQLKKDIQPYIKKYYDYTYQKLVEEEEIIRGNINNMSSEIKKIEFNIKDVNKDLSKASELVSDANARMNKEEQESKKKLIELYESYGFSNIPDGDGDMVAYTGDWFL